MLSDVAVQPMLPVKDLEVERTAKELKARGVTFEKYDNLPGTARQGDVHRAGDLKVVWFKDPGGNIPSVQNRPGRARRS